jgi:P2-related tail formation protein
MYTYEVVVAEKKSTTKTLKRKYDTTMSPVIKDLLRVAHKIVTFMCKTHVYLNPFLQTHISMKLWRKTPTTNTLKSVAMSMITTHLTKSCSQSVRCSPLNRHLLKPFLANTYIYKIVEKNSHNKHFEEETQHNNECGHKRPYKSCSQSIRSSPSYLKHTHVQKPFLANTYVYEVAEKTPQQTP